MIKTIQIFLIVLCITCISFEIKGQVKMECIKVDEIKYIVYIKNEGSNVVLIPDFKIKQQSCDTLYINEKFNFNMAKCKEFKYKILDSIYTLSKQISSQELVSVNIKTLPIPFDNPNCKFEVLQPEESREIIFYHKDFCSQINYVNIVIKYENKIEKDSKIIENIMIPIIRGIK